jgi:hypothetical protein
MPDKRRSKSGQGGLVIESRQKPDSLRLKQKLNGGSAGLAGSVARSYPKPEGSIGSPRNGRFASTAASHSVSQFLP